LIVETIIGIKFWGYVKGLILINFYLKI